MPGENSVCPGCNGRRLLSNAQGNPVTCPLCEGTGKMEPNYIRMPRWYPAGGSSSITLTGGAPGPQNAQVTTIDATAPFEVVWLVSTQGGIFDEQISDQSGRPWQTPATFIPNVNRWGTAQNPFPLVAPVIVPARANLNHLFRDQSSAGGAGNIIQPCFIGFELYEAP